IDAEKSAEPVHRADIVSGDRAVEDALDDVQFGLVQLSWPANRDDDLNQCQGLAANRDHRSDNARGNVAEPAEDATPVEGENAAHDADGGGRQPTGNRAGPFDDGREDIEQADHDRAEPAE